MTRLDTWNQLQANGLKAYHEIPEASCALAYRKDVKQFKRFIGKQDGYVLDIGCGIEVPGYLERVNLGHTTGIDPLPPQSDFGAMARLGASGEHVPFPKNWFDLVLLAGTLDHVLDPVQVLKEAGRVVKPSGRIVVQIGIPGSMPRQSLLTRFRNLIEPSIPPDGLQDRILKCKSEMVIPEGCADEFHFKYYTEPEIEALYAEAGLRVTRRRRIPGSTFYEVRK